MQFADFVAYNIIKLEGCKVKEQITDFMKQIHRMAYNGGHSISEIDQRSFWGMRVLPSYLRMEELLSENKTLLNICIRETPPAWTIPKARGTG